MANVCITIFLRIPQLTFLVSQLRVIHLPTFILPLDSGRHVLLKDIETHALSLSLHRSFSFRSLLAS